jgi:SAM-dependent methyltransferase
MTRDFGALVDEGTRVPVEGWDFSWFEGRATEQRPPWGYQRLLSAHLSRAPSALDLQTGGGEVVAGALQTATRHPRRLAATESWAPNLALARERLSQWNATVVGCGDDEVPFDDTSFALVSARHPTVTPWEEIARVLEPGGTLLSQQVGGGSVRELTEAMIGPYEMGDGRSPRTHVSSAEDAGLEVVRLETASLPMTFHDIAAVIVFLRKVIWIVPEFTVERYLPQLRALHASIEENGPFTATSERFLIECRRPS